MAAAPDPKFKSCNVTGADKVSSTAMSALLLQVVMQDPVIAGDGHTYERAAIQHWLQGSSLSPVTGEKLPHTRLVLNVLVKSALSQHARLSKETDATSASTC